MVELAAKGEIPRGNGVQHHIEGDGNEGQRHGGEQQAVGPSVPALNVVQLAKGVHVRVRVCMRVHEGMVEK